MATKTSKTKSSKPLPVKAEIKATKPTVKSVKSVVKKAASTKSISKPGKKPAATKTLASSLPATTKAGKLDKVKLPKAKSLKAKEIAGTSEETAQVLDSQVAYQGPLFRVLRDHIIEPGGQESYRDVIRHNGSVVILAVDHSRKHGKKNPWVVVERQYRHAAGQFLWELPAGKLDAGEKPIDGAKRELAEETGYQADEWTPLVEYFASPGFLGESMKVFLAEGLIAGDAHPEEDEHIDFRLVKLSEILEMVEKGKIIDGKTLTSILLYARKLGLKRKK